MQQPRLIASLSQRLDLNQPVVVPAYLPAAMHLSALLSCECYGQVSKSIPKGFEPITPGPGRH